MPFFSRRKSGKQSKVSKNDSENSKTQTNIKKVSISQGLNGIRTTPDLPRKDVFNSSNSQRPANSSAKCVANFPRRSRLSKSLPEVLVDDSILPLFLEFLQKQDAQNVLNFWLAAETFRLSSRDKNMFPYKSKLMVKSNHKACSDSSRLPFQLGTEVNMQLQTLQKCSSPNTKHDSLNSGDLDLRTGPSKPCLVSHNNMTGKKHPEISTLLHSSRQSMENSESNSSKLCDGIDCTSVQNSTASNSTLSNDDSALCSISPIGSEHSTGSSVSDTSVSERNDKLSEMSLRTENEYSMCSGTSDNNTNKNDATSENIPHEEICEGHELSRQESSGTREQRSMSNIMMDDALSIYRHFISLDASQPLGVDENIRREVESKICTEDGVIDPECFKIAQNFAFSTLENRYFDDFIRSSYYQKHIMDILTSGKVFLADIMYNDNAMFYFMEFMEQEEKSYLLAFWIAVDSFCQELQSKLDKKQYDADEALDDAMVLYDRYFSMQASNSLGVSDETRIRIENKICREGGPLPDCFEEPMENVLTLLEEVYFPIFLDSSIYFKYLNELFSSVTDVDSDQNYLADDCSSTASGSESLKLMESLASEVEAHEDPDEIWQRPQFGLSIGRVNEFGIYEPGIEPQPGKQALKFGQKMKKLVSGDSDKVKEEMAWKVAKMVLEDVKKQQKKSAR